MRFVPLVGEDAWEEPGGPPVVDRAAPRHRPGGDRGADSRGRRADRRHRRRGSRPAPRSHRHARGRPARRGDATAPPSSTDARPHHARADRAARLHDRRRRGRLARCRAGRSLRSPRSARSQEGDPPFTPLPDLDVAQRARCTTSSSGCGSWNADVPDPARRAGFYGLDLYSLFTSIAAVLRYLDDVDPDTAALARRRYGCLTPWQRDPAVYGRAALAGQYRSCEEPVIAHAARHAGAPARVRARATASASSMRPRTPGWWPTPSATTA